MNKNINVKKITFESNYDDYDYFILDGNKKYKCSNGEKQLFDFLSYFFINDEGIYLIDEPCVNLSHENMQKLKNLDLFKKPKSQLIIISHNRDIIDILMIPKVIHFRMTNGITNQHIY